MPRDQSGFELQQSVKRSNGSIDFGDHADPVSQPGYNPSITCVVLKSCLGLRYLHCSKAGECGAPGSQGRLKYCGADL